MIALMLFAHIYMIMGGRDTTDFLVCFLYGWRGPMAHATLLQIKPKMHDKKEESIK